MSGSPEETECQPSATIDDAECVNSTARTLLPNAGPAHPLPAMASAEAWTALLFALLCDNFN